MSKKFIICFISLLFFSCAEDKKNIVNNEDVTFNITTNKWPKKVAVSAKTAEVLKDWPEFKAVDSGFDALYRVGNTEDLSLVLEDLIEKQKLLQKSTYPKVFDVPQIKSRQKVFHTFILKTKGDLIYSIDTKESVNQLIDAYNAMLKQFDRITGKTLDLKTLLDE